MTTTLDETTILRVWQTPFIKIHPSILPYEYTGDCSRVLGIEKPLGDVEHTECMDAAVAGGFREDSEIEARPGSVTSSLVMKKSVVNAIKAELWEKCRWNIDVRTQFENSGARDDQLNWHVITRIKQGKFTALSTDDETVFTRDDTGEVLMTMPFSAPPLWQWFIRQLSTELVDTDKAGNITCIDHQQAAICPSLSGPQVGCRLAVGTAAIAGNPEVGISDDEGETWTWFSFDGTSDTPTWTNPITGISAKDDFIIVVSTGEAAHAVSIDNGATWTEVALADYAANPPVDVVAYSPTRIWICGENGYIWYSSDGGITASTSPRGDAGVVTTNDYVRIKALSDRFVIAVGVGNAIALTENGGETWSFITGDVAQAAIQVNSVAMWDENIWVLVYEDGELYWTDDKGVTWTEDEQLTGLSATALNDVDINEAERYMVVGEDADGNALIYENVHGAPGKWQRIEPPGDVQELFAVVNCDQNAWIAVGEVTYTGAEGAIVRAIG